MNNYTVQTFLGDDFYTLFEDEILYPKFAQCYHEIAHGNSQKENIRKINIQNRSQVQELIGSLLQYQNKVVGYCWGTLVAKQNLELGEVGFPFSPDHKDQVMLTKKILNWLSNVTTQQKLFVIKQMATLPEHRGSSSSFLLEPLLNYANDMGYTLLLCRTDIASPVFKMAIGTGCIPLPIELSKEGNVLMHGHIPTILDNIKNEDKLKGIVANANARLSK